MVEQRNHELLKKQDATEYSPWKLIASKLQNPLNDFKKRYFERYRITEPIKTIYKITKHLQSYRHDSKTK